MVEREFLGRRLDDGGSSCNGRLCGNDDNEAAGQEAPVKLRESFTIFDYSYRAGHRNALLAGHGDFGGSADNRPP